MVAVYLAWLVVAGAVAAQEPPPLPTAETTLSPAASVTAAPALATSVAGNSAAPVSAHDGSTQNPLQIASLANQPSATGPMLTDPAAAPGQSSPELVEAVPLGSPAESPSPSSSEEMPYWTRMWHLLPRGVLPICPRTPDDEKDRGIWGPLPGRGWRTNPFAITPFVGVTYGSPLIEGHLKQLASFYGGVNIAWDYDHYWGFEKRLGFGAMNLMNGQDQMIPSTGLSVTGEYRLMYYPLGDSRWRPFLTAGVGWSNFYFTDDRGVNHFDTVGMVPFGGGLKYLINDRLAVRMDLIDEMTFAGGVLSNFHYAAFTIGLEIRYGHRLLNLPWHRSQE